MSLKGMFFVVCCNVAAISLSAQQPVIIDSVVSRLLRQERFSGSVLLAKNGNIVYQRTEGFEDRSKNLPFTPFTVSSIASVGKIFTAAMIEKLVAQGKLQLNQTLDHYLPQYKIPNAQHITLRHLLNHTAGTGNYMQHPRFAALLNNRGNADSLLALVLESASGAQAPGEKHVYSNSGYILLGRIIESVTGKPYKKALQEMIIRPAGMEAFVFQPAKGANLAQGYVKDQEQWKATGVSTMPAADGGLYTTALDLFRFDKAFYKDRIVDAPHRAEMQNNSVEAELPGLGKMNYGLGLMRFNYSNGAYSYGHNGGFAGFGCEYKHYFLPDGTEYTLIIMSNYDRSIRPLMYWIESLLLDKKV